MYTPKENKAIIHKTIEHLQNGDSVILPSDTLWSLSCNPFNQNAVNDLFSIKKRDPSKNFILLVSSIDMLLNYVDLSSDQIKLINSFDRPTTIIYTSTKNIPDYLLRKEDNSIAIRLIQKECFCKDLINQWNKALVSTSVNESGQAAVTNINALSDSILKGIDYIVDLPSEIDPNSHASQIIKINPDQSIDIIRA